MRKGGEGRYFSDVGYTAAVADETGYDLVALYDAGCGSIDCSLNGKGWVRTSTHEQKPQGVIMSFIFHDKSDYHKS